MVDQVLRGIAGGDFADVLLRAAAFARVVATGRAALPRGAPTAEVRGCWCWPSSSRRRVTPSCGPVWRDLANPVPAFPQRWGRALNRSEHVGPRQPRVPQ